MKVYSRGYFGERIKFMKHAVSISIGSSKRDKTVEITLLGEKVRLERIGTDGDMKKAAQLYKAMDRLTHLVWVALLWVCWLLITGIRFILFYL
jgi:hypothetical protein